MNAMNWHSCWAIARRDLNTRIKGLRLLFVCLLLGVTTLAAIGSLTAAIGSEIAGKGQILLGGDIEVAMSQREASPEESQALAQLGPVSTTIRMRAMAQRPLAPPGAPDTLLSELKGVDAAYPLYGSLALQGGAATDIGPDEILIAPELAERMALRPGDSIRYGTAPFRVRAIIADEPDRMSEGFTLGPVSLVSLEGLRRTALIQPGSLYESKYRIRLAPGADAKAVASAFKQRFSSAGWAIKDRDNAAPGASRFLERMGQFLSLIGLAALIIAGIGVSNGVGSYLNQKRNGIASLKILGATSRDIARIYLMQIGAVAVAAILLGLAIGALLPPVLGKLAGDMLPVQPGWGIHPAALATSAAYGLLIALAFTAIPLGRARTEPAAALLRGMVQQQARPDRQTLATIALCALAILLVALITAREPLFSAAVLAAVMLVLALLLLVGRGIGWLAARLPRARRPLWRLAIANLYRPGAQTGALVVALGLAFTLFVTLASVRTSIDSEIRHVVPERAPNQFVLDIPMADEPQFRAIVKAQAPEAQLNVVPTLRGTIIAYAGQRVSALKTIPEGAWVLRGERGITYSATLPQGSTLVVGQWWPRDYRGPPQISLDRKVAQTLGLKLGDSMTISILGREIEARIVSLREVKWETMGFNYAIVFDPATLRSAPHSLTATITMNDGREAQMSRAILAAFPSASIIATGDVVGQIQTLLGQMSAAITAAASVAIFAGIAVLVGAILASRQSRSYDSVILKTLGATRGQILQVQALEYVLLATILAGLALLLGSLAGWYVVTGVFAFQWAPDWGAIATILLAGIVITVGMGLAGSWPVLSVRPASALRDAM